MTKGKSINIVQLGKAVAIVGISAGLSVLSGCSDKAKKVAPMSEEQKWQAEGRVKIEPRNQIDGDVEYQYPVDSVIIEKEPKAIKKRTASFKKIKKEKKDSTDDRIYDVVEQMPSFPGGQKKMLDYLEQNTCYPVIAEENGILGRVVVTFVVEKDGSIDNVKIARGVHPSLDEEAARVVKRMPKWNPGKQDGKAVRTRYIIPVDFRLE